MGKKYAVITNTTYYNMNTVTVNGCAARMELIFSDGQSPPTKIYLKSAEELSMILESIRVQQGDFELIDNRKEIVCHKQR